ncbi:MAG: rnd [Anaerolineales bacterium]|nr:rnd [Anaerolineales bacterium]
MPDASSTHSHSLPPPVFVADARGLAALVRALAGEPALAVDTESNSLFAYRERVCLIQFSTPARDYILDPLALPDLGSLAPLFANPQQQKVFHAAEYDLLCLKRDYDFEFAEIFDTMIAARTLGWPQMGLAAILEARFGVKMNKKYQRANWGQRPLTPAQLDYARLDTHYLFALRDVLQSELAAASRVEEAREEFARLTRVKPEPNGSDRHGFWRINGARDLPSPQAAVLRELYLYRERQAERADRPPFKIMSDQTLLEIAQRCPAQTRELQGVMGMTPAQIHRHGAGLLGAVQRGLSAPPPHPPPPAFEPDVVRERYERLRQWRKQKAQARGVESDIIIPREAMWQLARRAPRTPDELAGIEELGPWRRQTYGMEILQVLGSTDETDKAEASG